MTPIEALAEGLCSSVHRPDTTPWSAEPDWSPCPDHLAEAERAARTPSIAALLAEAEVGRAMKRLEGAAPRWRIDHLAVHGDEMTWEYEVWSRGKTTCGPTLPAAIQAALGEDGDD